VNSIEEHGFSLETPVTKAEVWWKINN